MTLGPSAPHDDTPPADTAAPREDLSLLLYERPGFLLRRAHQISVSVFESACAEIALTPAQYAVLTVLQADGSLDQSSVARAIGLDKVTVSLLLRGLETRGLVDRKPVPENRRRRALTLTPMGLHVLRLSRAPTEAAYEKLMAPFSQAEREQLIGLLQQMVDGLEHLARAPLKPLGGSRCGGAPAASDGNAD